MRAEDDVSSPSLVRASAVMSLGTVLSRATGLLRLIAITAALGVAEGRLADSYNLANTLPNIVYGLVLGGITSSIFVPVFVELVEKEGRDRAWEAISALINVLLAALLAIALAGILLAPWIAKFYSIRLEGQQAQLQQEVITFWLRLFIPQIIFYGLAEMTTGLLNAHKRFAPPTYTPIINNLTVIVALLIFYRVYGHVGLQATNSQLWLIGMGTTLGVILYALAQLPFLRGLGPYRLTFSLKHPSLKKVGRLSVFMVGFVAVNEIGQLVVQWLANKQQGGYSAYVAAHTFILLPTSLFVISVTTALLPDMSSHAIGERWDEFKERVSLGIRGTLFLVLPAAVGYVALANSILNVLLSNGVMTARSIDLVDGALRYMALGLPQAALFFVLVRSFFAMQNSRTPFFIALSGVAVNAAINIVLFAWMEVSGLALGLAIANTFSALVAGWALSRAVGGLDVARLGRSSSRILAAAIGMGVVVWLGHEALQQAIGSSRLADAASLGVSIALGVFTYLGLAQLLRVEELVYMRRLLGRRAP